MLKLFITNLSEYNSGNLVGEWVELPSDSLYLNQTIRKVLSSDNSEEIFITDWEWADQTIFEVDQYDDPRELNAKVFKLSQQSPYQQQAIAFLLKERICDDIDDAIHKSYDVVIHKNKTMADIAYDRVKEYVGMSKVPDIISNHIDYTSMGKEIRTNGYFVMDANIIYEYIGD